MMPQSPVLRALGVSGNMAAPRQPMVSQPQGGSMMGHAQPFGGMPPSSYVGPQQGSTFGAGQLAYGQANNHRKY